MKHILPILLTLILCGIAQAQVKPYTESHDRFKISASYLNTEFDLNPLKSVKYLKGFSIDADARIYEYEGFRLGGVFNYQKVFDQTVIVNYLDVEDQKIYNLQRDVNTFSFGAQFSKKAGPVEPFGAFFLGFRRLHEDFDRDVVRKYRVGVDLIFHKESNFFIRPFFVEFERGTRVINYLGTSNVTLFVTGTTQKYGAGAGFRF